MNVAETVLPVFMSVVEPQLAYPIRLDYVFERPAFATFCPVDYLDVSGRPVLEGRSVAHRPSAANYVVCPYSDGRLNHERPMNVGALKTLKNERLSSASIISRLGAQMARTLETGARPTVLDLYRLAYICHKTPTYWALRRGDGHVGFEIPSDYAVVSRFSHGLMHLFSHLATYRPGSMLDVLAPEELYRYADENELLVGIREVCAGPPRLIVHTIENMVTALASRSTTSDVDEKSNAIEQALVDFGGLCHSMEVLSTVYETVRCAAWNWRNTIAFDSCKGLHAVDFEQPKMRHAVPYCFITWEASRLPDPLGVPFISGLISCRWRLLGDHGGVLEILDSQIACARDLAIAFRNDDSSVRERWRRFELITADGITAVNRALKSSLALRKTVVQFDLRELELFFGMRPFDERPNESSTGSN